MVLTLLGAVVGELGESGCWKGGEEAVGGEGEHEGVDG